MRWEEENAHKVAAANVTKYHSKRHSLAKNREYVSIDIDSNLTRKRRPSGIRSVHFQDEETDMIGLNHALKGTEKKKKKSRKKPREKETRSQEHDRRKKRSNVDYNHETRRRKSRKSSQKIAGSRSNINKETKSRERVRQKKKKRELMCKRARDLDVE